MMAYLCGQQFAHLGMTSNIPSRDKLDSSQATKHGSTFQLLPQNSWNAVWVAETTPGRLPRKWLLVNVCERMNPISTATEEFNYI
jgi:hypothetical protein